MTDGRTGTPKYGTLRGMSFALKQKNDKLKDKRIRWSRNENNRFLLYYHLRYQMCVRMDRMTDGQLKNNMPFFWGIKSNIYIEMLLHYFFS